MCAWTIHAIHEQKQADTSAIYSSLLDNFVQGHVGITNTFLLNKSLKATYALLYDVVCLWLIGVLKLWTYARMFMEQYVKELAF